MSSLIPEKRVDKNGVLTTKHVRAGSKTKASLKGVPAPTVAKAVPVASTVQKRWRVNVSHWEGGGYNELEAICRDRFAPAQTYECSEAEAYSLFAAVDPENILPLLAVGIRSNADARSFMKQVGLERLIRDHSDLAGEAVSRGLPALDFIKFASANKLSLNRKTFMDAAEVDANPKMKKVDLLRKDFTVLPSISTMVLIGWIRASDLKELGEDIVVRHGARFEASRRTRDLIWNQLHLLKQNKLAYKSVSTMRQIILDNQDKNTRQIKDSLICAGLYGLDSVTDVAPGYIYEGQRLDEVVIDRSVPERRKVYEYAVNLRKSSPPRNLEPEEIIQLSDAGLPSKVAVEGVNEGMTAPQIIALHQGDVAPSISKGWL